MSRLCVCSILYLIALPGCMTGSHSQKGVELAMKQYDHLIKKMDTDSIALLYAPDGELGKMARGRDSIRVFLSKFRSMSVLSQQSTSEMVQLQGDTARQEGSYKQIVVVTAHDTVTVKGKYAATWIWTEPTGWLIKKMTTELVK